MESLRYLLFDSEAHGLVISRSYGRGIPTPSLFSPPFQSGDPGGPPSITP
jgi:hypothetical protein